MDSTFLERLALWMYDAGRARVTVAAYVAEAARCARASGRSLDALVVTPEAFAAACAASLSEAGLAPATLRRRWQVLRAVARCAGLPAPDAGLRPARGAVAPRRIQAVQLCPLAPERGRGRHEAAWRRDRAVALLSFGLGLRPAELSALTVGDVAVTEGRAWLTVGRGASRRRLPLPGDVRRALLDYLVVRPAGVEEASPLFLARDGKPLPYRTLRHGLVRFLRAGGGPAATASEGRRALCAAWLEQHPGDLSGVATLLGRGGMGFEWLLTSGAEGVGAVEPRRLDAVWRSLARGRPRRSKSLPAGAPAC